MEGVFAPRDLMIARRERVLAPFPDISCNVEQAMAIWRKGMNRRGAGIAVFHRVEVGEFSLPDIAAVLAAGRQLIAPGKRRLFQPAAGGQLPLGFGRQPRSRPL